MSDLRLAETDTNDAAEMAGARAAVYGFLSQLLLAPPTEAALAKLRDRGFVVDLATSLGLAPSPEIDKLSEAAYGSLNSLAQEYHDLFLVPLGRYVAPYEAVYRGAREDDGRWLGGHLQSEYTVAVLAIYREAEAKIAADVLDLPDHIGLELAFMQFICEEEHETWQRNDNVEAMRLIEIQKSFLEEHLGQWAPVLCRRIQEKAEGPLYKGLAHLVKAFISAELETVGSGCSPSDR